MKKSKGKPNNYFPSGVVDYSLFTDIYEQQSLLLTRIEYLIKTMPSEDCNEGVCLIRELVASAEIEIRDLIYMARADNKQAGGNEIYTTRDPVPVVRNWKELNKEGLKFVN